MSSKKPAFFTRTVGAVAVGLVVVCVAAAAMLMAARPPAQPVDTSVEETQPQPEAVVEPTPKKAPVARAKAKKPSASAVVAAVAAAPADARPDVAMAASSPAAAKSAPTAAVQAQTQEQEPVTIAGCLERDDERFRLKDTTGADAPKSRSWKSGFLKKGAATIEVLDASHRLNLPDHVGERVNVTGMLVDREMQARSLQRVAGSCD